MCSLGRYWVTEQGCGGADTHNTTFNMPGSGRRERERERGRGGRQRAKEKPRERGRDSEKEREKKRGWREIKWEGDRKREQTREEGESERWRERGREKERHGKKETKRGRNRYTERYPNQCSCIQPGWDHWYPSGLGGCVRLDHRAERLNLVPSLIDELSATACYWQAVASYLHAKAGAVFRPQSLAMQTQLNFTVVLLLWDSGHTSHFRSHVLCILSHLLNRFKTCLLTRVGQPCAKNMGLIFPSTHTSLVCSQSILTVA